MSDTNNISIKFWKDAILNSYSQIFFSENKIFACIILLVTFFDVKLGISGFCAVLLINSLSKIIGLNTHAIKKGVYGFNAVFLGVGLGYTYQFNTPFYILFAFAIILLLVLTVWINGFFEKKQLPFLAFPFLITFWIVQISASNFKLILLDESHAYVVNTLVKNQASNWYNLVHYHDAISIPTIVSTYFKTLSAIFFQNTILGGILISIGLLISSRISFTLSIIGFIAAYFFFKLLGADSSYLTYQLAGSNFIFMAIAIGGFFAIPNIYSYFAVIVVTPLLILVLFFVEKIVDIYHLKTYTLSFSVMVTIFLFFLHQRWLQKYLHLVTIHYDPIEKTLYKYLNSAKRFKNLHLAKVQLPFWGTWKVSQGYNGNITHLEDWSNALDFVIVNEDDKTYKNTGTNKDDFYCYNKPIIAPLDGYVYDIINNVEENEINDVNTIKNWGNSIVINHLNGLFSQISHIKKDSFLVNTGDYITKGTTLAMCGNSGRSPEPHIHFQLQTTPKIGEKTLVYPLGYYIDYTNKKMELIQDEIPTENSLIANVETTKLLTNAFNFKPGQTIKYIVNGIDTIEWKILTDAYNRTYFYCERKQSSAYFINDGTMFYFTDFEGDKSSYLFQFYIAFYKVLLGYYPEITIKDELPLVHFNNKVVQFIQDFFAPFYLFSNATYHSEFEYTDSIFSPEEIGMKSIVNASVFKKKTKLIQFNIEIKNDKIQQFKVQQKNKKTTFICIN
jgi:urea transporter/murein DD-endopeptidase MepM/ murein hydrolase activator NlpD